MVTRLLDANVLIALFEGDHVHHRTVRRWFAELDGGFATCPLVENALVRWIVRTQGRDGIGAAITELRKLARDPRHQFWPDALPLAEVRWHGVLGHQQVSDAYLAQLARVNAGRVATLDRGFWALHDDVAEMIAC